MTPELQQYIDQCKAHGMDEPAIRAALKASGWTEEVLMAVWPAAPSVPTEEVTFHFDDSTHEPVTDPAQVTQKKHRPRWVAWVATLGGVVIILAGLITVGESGYSPALSRIYRRTSLPLIWQGTTADPGLNLGRALLATVQQPKFKLTMASQGTISNLDPNVATKVSLFTTPKSSIGPTLADVTPPAVPAASSETGSASLAYDADTGAQIDYAIGIPDALRQLTGDYLKTSFTSLSIDAIFPKAGTSVFLRTNALPIPTKDDQDRWFNQAVSSNETFSGAQTSAQNILQQGDNQTRKDLDTIAKVTTVDMGIIRHNGVAAAWYHTLLTPDVLRTLSGNVTLSSDRRDLLKQTADGWKSGQVSIDWYVDARHPRLIDLAVKAEVVSAAATLKQQGTLSASYGTAAAVTIPTHLWTSFGEYFSAVQANQSTLFDTGALTQSAVDLLAGEAGALPK